MASEDPTPENNGSWLSQVQQRLGSGPRFWSFFQNKEQEAKQTAASAAVRAAASSSTEALSVSQPYVPSSGATVTLRDLARDPASKPPPLPTSLSADWVPEDGWIGVPDPTKYAPDTTTLTRAELEEEIKKGNVMTLKDYQAVLERLSPEHKELVMRWSIEDIIRNQSYVTLEDGSWVSFGDLLDYAYKNPELAKLAASGRSIPVARGSSAQPLTPAERDAQQAALLEPWEEQGDAGDHLTVPQEVAEAMPLALVAEGAIWSRKPTRWFRGIDGVKDWEVGVYVDEDLCHERLGPMYGHIPATRVLKDKEYAGNCLAAAPLVNMNIWMRAAREMPLQQTVDAWKARLQEHLHKQPRLYKPLLPSSEEPAGTGMGSEAGDETPSSQRQATTSSQPSDALAPSPAGKLRQTVSFEQAWAPLDDDEHAEVLANETAILQDIGEALTNPDIARSSQLLTRDGKSIRAGSTLIISMGGEGQFMLRAHSRGTQREREWYMMGAGVAPGLQNALVNSLLGPSGLSPEIGAQAAMNMLPLISGMKLDLPKETPDPLVVAPHLHDATKHPKAYALPAIGQPRSDTLLQDVQRSLLARQHLHGQHVAGPTSSGPIGTDKEGGDGKAEKAAMANSISASLP